MMIDDPHFIMLLRLMMSKLQPGLYLKIIQINKIILEILPFLMLSDLEEEGAFCSVCKINFMMLELQFMLQCTTNIGNLKLCMDLKLIFFHIVMNKTKLHLKGLCNIAVLIVLNSW